MTSEAERQLRRVAERLGTLKGHAGFVILVEEIEKKRARMKEALAARLMDGREDVAVLKEQAAYDRGFYDGARYSVAVVNGAAKKLEEWDAGAEVTEPEEETDGWARY
jgi:hypothetical protein